MSESRSLVRQWRLLRQLTDARVGYTVKELHGDMSVSIETIRRDLNDLGSAGLEFANPSALVVSNAGGWKDLTVGKRRTLRVRDKEVVGFEVLLEGDATRIQYSLFRCRLDREALSLWRSPRRRHGAHWGMIR